MAFGVAEAKSVLQLSGVDFGDPKTRERYVVMRAEFKWKAQAYETHIAQVGKIVGMLIAAIQDIDDHIGLWK